MQLIQLLFHASALFRTLRAELWDFELNRFRLPPFNFTGKRNGKNDACSSSSGGVGGGVGRAEEMPCPLGVIEEILKTNVHLRFPYASHQMANPKSFGVLARFFLEHVSVVYQEWMP